MVVDIATTRLYPAAITHMSELTATASNLSEMGLQLEHSGVENVVAQANGMMAAVNELSAALAGHDFSSTEAHMTHCAHTICPLMLKVRTHADALEALVADDLWPLPKYQEMLFIK